MSSKFMEIEIEILGADFVFDVEYVITSYGSHDTWFEPGDAPELYIDQVVNKRTGEDMTDWLDKHHDWWNKGYKPWVEIVYKVGYKKDVVIKDELIYLMFGRPGPIWGDKNTELVYASTLRWNALTWLEVLRDIIYQREEFDEGGDRGGYD